MKPYYEQDGITIYHADCREVLPTLSPVDLVLTDPPYGIALANHGLANHRRRAASFRIAGDESSEAGQDALDWAASRDIATIAFAHSMRPWRGEWRQHLVWDKGGAVGGGGDIATCWKQTWELIQVARTRRLSGARDSAVLRFFITPSDSGDHIAAKPLELLRYLLLKADPHGTVLDPFMGSGTTLVAAKSLGLSAVGVELDERYCEIAAERLRQRSLFTPEPVPVEVEQLALAI